MLTITKRELEVIELLADGKTNSEIGDYLCVSAHTVKSILEKIYDKTNCHSRVQVVVWAIQNDVINLKKACG